MNIVPFLVVAVVVVVTPGVDMTVYALPAARGRAALRRRRTRAALDAVSGIVLVGFGVRLAFERR